jgi:hypothetical protein
MATTVALLIPDAPPMTKAASTKMSIERSSSAGVAGTHIAGGQTHRAHDAAQAAS